MPLPQMLGKLHFRPPPLGCLLIGKEHARKRIPSLEIVTVIVDLGGYINDFGEFVSIFHVDEASLVTCAQARVIKAEIQNRLRSWIVFVARAEGALNAEIMKGDIAEKALE